MIIAILAISEITFFFFIMILTIKKTKENPQFNLLNFIKNNEKGIKRNKI